MVESAPTRRSNRLPSSPMPAMPETPGLSRTEPRGLEQIVAPTRRSTRAARLRAAAPQPVRDTDVSAAEPFELIEPSIDAAPAAAEPIDEPAPAASGTDEFEAAARLFSFTGENPVMTDAAEPAIDPQPAVHVAPPRRSRRAMIKRAAGASFSVGVMGIVGLLTVGLTTTAEAVAPVAGTDVATSLRVATGTDAAEPDDEIQAYVAPSTLDNADVSKTESYSTVTMAQLAFESGITNVSDFFVNDPNSAIQWPFAVGVPITYGFGMRSGAMHEGVDFVPGAGAPIQAIADGTVRVATDSGGGYGVHVIIDHVIDGQLVSSHYAHMITGSIEVTEGEQVKVGTVIGRTGNTGRSFGAHTHFEILANGTTPIDPIPWLREHAGG